MQYASDALQRTEVALQATDRINPKVQVQPEQWQTLTENVGDFDRKTGTEHAQKIEPSARLSGSSALPQTSNTPTQNQPEARFVAQQLGGHLSNQKEKTTTIRLTPEDLGHVRMTLRTNDTGLSLAIFAERPETAEFMRRNIEVLVQEFQSLGFENLNFQFDGDAPNENANAKIDAVLSDEGDVVEKQNPSRIQPNIMDGRLDIRI
jgi:flagellar hook-length control protein FliK